MKVSEKLESSEIYRGLRLVGIGIAIFGTSISAAYLSVNHSQFAWLAWILVIFFTIT